MISTSLYMEQLCPYDTRSFDSTFRKYYTALAGFANSLLMDRNAARDIVSDIFIVFWHKRNDFTEERAVKAFLYISTRNACVNYLAQEQRTNTRKKNYRYILDESCDHVLNEIIRAEVLREIENAIEGLPNQCRKIILMAYSDGLKYREIASRLQLSRHTVRNQIVRGIKLIKERIEY